MPSHRRGWDEPLIASAWSAKLRGKPGYWGLIAHDFGEKTWLWSVQAPKGEEWLPDWEADNDSYTKLQSSSSFETVSAQPPWPAPGFDPLAMRVSVGFRGLGWWCFGGAEVAAAGRKAEGRASREDGFHYSTFQNVSTASPGTRLNSSWLFVTTPNP